MFKELWKVLLLACLPVQTHIATAFAGLSAAITWFKHQDELERARQGLEKTDRKQRGPNYELPPVARQLAKQLCESPSHSLSTPRRSSISHRIDRRPRFEPHSMVGNSLDCSPDKFLSLQEEALDETFKESGQQENNLTDTDKKLAARQRIPIMRGL